MSTVIWKFVLGPANDWVEMPAGARILHTAAQGDELCVWAEVVPSAPRVRRRVEVVPAGGTVPTGATYANYVGTAHMLDAPVGRELVFHVYDTGEELFRGEAS